MDAAAIVAFMIMLLLCVYFMRAFIDQRINYFESFLYSLFPFPSFFFFFKFPVEAWGEMLCYAE
jgi:hypothetical protein